MSARKIISFACAGIVMCVVATVTALALSAPEAQTSGLFVETQVQFDEVTMRRVRDTSEHVVCYAIVARFTGYYNMYGRLPAISCVPESPR